VWLGDQFCSLTFSLSNLYLLGCVYVTGFDANWEKRCGVTASQWPVALFLASLPLLVRLVQCVRRYADSGLLGGKYGTGIVNNIFFYLWKHQGDKSCGDIFAIWCLFNTTYSIYACSWDFWMDWSVLRPRARYLFLRSELLYPGHVPLYYLAIIINLFLRFTWFLYIPRSGPSMAIRSFIVQILEMLRRWIWNFIRLENEHLINISKSGQVAKSSCVHTGHHSPKLDCEVGATSQRPCEIVPLV